MTGGVHRESFVHSTLGQFDVTGLRELIAVKDEALRAITTNSCCECETDVILCNRKIAKAALALLCASGALALAQTAWL